MAQQKPKWLPDESTQRLKTRRKKSLSLKLEEMESRTGLSKSHLSNIENGKRDPSRGAFDKIVEGYQIYNPSSYIHPENYKKADIITFKLDDPHEKINWEKTSCEVPQGLELENMVMFPGTVTMPPGVETEMKSHIIEEYAFVLEGQVIFRINNKEYIIKQNESIHFKSSLPHTVRNPTKEPVRLLIIRCP